MKRKLIVIIIAAVGILSAFWAVKRGAAPAPAPEPIASPPQKPYIKTVAASGLIEADGENISIGTPENGIVEQLYVTVGSSVKKGDPLFRLETCELTAELTVAEARKVVAQAEYNQLVDQLRRLQAVKDPRAISQEEVRFKENEVAIASARLSQAESEIEKTTALLNRRTVRSPIDGTVLKLSVRVGEAVVATDTDHPPMMIGDITHLQIRADIDEQNASTIVAGLPATAYPKNRPNYPIPLQFVRIEPYVKPKTSLTGSSKEKVDTRVLQVVYRLDPPHDISLYVGQQVDVYIERPS